MVKPIETTYKGYRFRSRLEARWAVFLDAMREPWEYEKEGYAVDAGWYLPDFWLPRLGCWLEIKGQTPNRAERTKCEQLSELTECPAVLADGLPHAVRLPCDLGRTVHPERLTTFCRSVIPDQVAYRWAFDNSFWAIDRAGRLCLGTLTDDPGRVFLTPGYTLWEGMKAVRDIYRPITEAEANHARAARFEHGQQVSQVAPQSFLESALERLGSTPTRKPPPPPPPPKKETNVRHLERKLEAYLNPPGRKPTPLDGLRAEVERKREMEREREKEQSAGELEPADEDAPKLIHPPTRTKETQ